MSVYEVISKLPGIETVRSHSQAMAMLEAILCPDWSYRFFSFDSRWSAGESLASMQDGSGNDYPLEPRPGLFEAVPAAFRSFVEEPAFCDAGGVPRATACFWRQPSDDAWSAGPLEFPTEEHKDVDGTEWMFEVLVDGTAEGYRAFAEECYEVVPDITAIRHVYELKPLTQEIVSALNPDVDLADLAEDSAQIGYPGQGPTDPHLSGSAGETQSWRAPSIAGSLAQC